MNRRWLIGHSLDFHGGRKCLLQQSSSFSSYWCARPFFIWENMLEQPGLVRWWCIYSCWFVRRRPAGPLERSGDMFSWRRPAAGCYLPSWSWVSQSIGCSTGAPWITPGTVTGPNENQWVFRVLWFWMRWKVDSMAGAFRPIKGWLPEKMVQ